MPIHQTELRTIILFYTITHYSHVALILRNSEHKYLANEMYSTLNITRKVPPEKGVKKSPFINANF